MTIKQEIASAFGWTLVIIGFCVALVGLFGGISAQTAKPVWVSKETTTWNEAVELLNRLPADRAVDAKIVAFSSDRTSWSLTGRAYAVVYRQ